MNREDVKIGDIVTPTTEAWKRAYGDRATVLSQMDGFSNDFELRFESGKVWYFACYNFDLVFHPLDVEVLLNEYSID